MESVVWVLGAYVLGSLPPAVWISKYVYGSDIRTHGSGNAGSTNMYRVFGFKAGLATQVLDILKGWVAAMLPVWLMAGEGSETRTMWQLACGVAAVVGHVYTVFAGFRGGKGVNTILGMMLAIAPGACAVGLTVFGVVLLAFGMVSLASMTAVGSFPVYVAAMEPDNRVLLVTGIALFVYVVYTHRSNIRRIAAGKESKVNLISKIRGKAQK
jgi:glycerol-3-phosphate acyltransferase PlsY